jgi:hypothetical protein
MTCSTAVSVASDDTKKYAGRPVVEVLQELRAAGLRILFSSDLVPATLRVKSEPRDRNPRKIAEQILAPHGLTLEEGPRDTLLVVAAPKTARPPTPSRTREAPRPRSELSPSEQPEPVRIEEWVEVTDTLIEPTAGTTTYSVAPTAIRETAGGFENVFQVLQFMPGAAAIDDEAGKLAVRGSGPEHNIVVLDGVQIHNPYRFSELTSSFLNPSTAARVSLDASGLDAAHGGRLSSVTVIETRDGRRDRRLATAISMGLAAGDVLLEGRLPNSESGSWWVTARGTYYRPIVNLFRSGVVPNFGDLQFKIASRPSRRTTLAVFGLVGRESTKGGDELSRRVEFQGNNRLGVVNLSWTPHSRLLSTTTVSGYAHDARDYDDSFSGLLPPFERRVSVHDFSARQRTTFAVSARHVLDAGVDVHDVRSSSRLASYRPGIFPRGLGPSVWGEQIVYPPSGAVDSRLARTQVGFWVQDRLPLGRRLSIEPGVRLDWNSFTEEYALQPRLRLVARFGAATAWGGVATQTQTPSHESLQGLDYYHLSQSDGATLRNERSRQFVAGVEYPLGADLSLRVETYRRRFDRLLVQRLESDEQRAARLAPYEIPPDMPPDDVLLERRPTEYAESTGRGTASGIELVLQRNGRRLSGWLGYSFSRTRREAHGYSFPFDFDRPHTLTAVANVHLSRRFRLSGTLLQASGFAITPVREEVLFTQTIRLDGSWDPILRPARNRDGSLVMSPSALMRRLSLRNSDRLRPYSRLDLRVTYATLGRWEFYGEVINLLNARNYLQGLPTPSLGRGADEPSEHHDNVYENFERFPSFGVRVFF